MKSDRIFTNQILSPVGHISTAAHLHEALGVPRGLMRRYSTHGLIYLLSGEGVFMDSTGFETDVKAGDLILLFPGIAHEYHPTKGKSWEEIYVFFEGSVFNLWMLSGLMQPTEPVLRLNPIDYWSEELNRLIGWRPLLGPEEALKQICALQHFLSAAFCEQVNLYEDGSRKKWVDTACGLLRQGKTPQEVAREMGQTYETFRKDFVHRTGSAPGKFRAECLIHRGAEMLLNRDCSLAEIADELGFSDAFHFSARFKQMTGKSPREFRALTPEVR